MQIWAESGKSALPICNYSQILYQFLTFTQNLKRSPDRTQNVFALVGFFLPCCPLQFITALLYCSAAHAGKVFYAVGF